jgi:hypothetical protein
MSSRAKSILCNAFAVCGLITILALVSGCGSSSSTSAATLKSIAINPSAATNIPKGATQQFTASGTFSDNSTKDITTSVTWASDNTNAVTISNTASTQGLATAVASSGSAHISASMSGITSPTVTVTAQPAALKSIAVTGGSSVNVGATDQFAATGTLTDNTTKDLTTSVTWSSATPANATISGTGVATGVHSGTTMITATDSATGITSPAVTLTVVAVLSSIAITPAPAVNIALGGTQNFSASATFNDGTMQATFTTSCAWTSSNPAAVTISASTGVAMVPNNAAVGATSNISCSAAMPAGTPTVTSNTVVATVTTTALAIATTSLPNATVGTAYDQLIQTSGGDGTAITFALANGTTLPAWASLNASTGHITGTPAAGDVGTSAPFQISATQSGNTVTSGSLTITVVASGTNNAELKGTYAFLLRGFDAGGHAMTIGGSFIADGAGNITGGVMDINNASSGPITDLTITPAPLSVYSVGADNRGLMVLHTGGPTESFDFSVGAISAGVASLGHIISRQATLATVGSAISGVFKKQDTSAFNLTTSTGIGGDFAFLSEGADSGGNRVATAGRVTINSDASLANGAIDINDNGIFDNGVAGPLPFTGSVDSGGAIDATTGRGTMTLNIAPPSGPTLHQAFYVVSGGEVLILSTDPIDANHTLYSSSGLRQSTTFCPTTGACAFTNSVLNGTAVVYIQSNSGPSSNPSCSLAGASSVQVGALTFTPATTSFSGGFDANDCGTIATPSTDTASGTYAVAPNGRVTLTGGQHPPFLYMVDTNRGFLIGTNTGRVETGVGEPQAAPPFTVISGGRAFGAESPAVKGSLVYSGVETVTAGTPSSITQIRQDQNAIQGGLREDVPLLNDTFTIDATGRITFGSGLKVGYFINSTRTVVIDVQSTDTTPTISISDNQ